MLPDVGPQPFSHTCYRALTPILGHNTAWFLLRRVYSQCFYFWFGLDSLLTPRRRKSPLACAKCKRIAFFQQRGSCEPPQNFAIVHIVYHSKSLFKIPSDLHKSQPNITRDTGHQMQTTWMEYTTTDSTRPTLF